MGTVPGGDREGGPADHPRLVGGQECDDRRDVGGLDPRNPERAARPEQLRRMRNRALADMDLGVV